ncbi:MAG: protein-glutamate O-methyltransferase CheR [Deltaproteobacteria bacterium]|nr:protein-glutamate O-methyltransferase CheR [Deltaproteobacteria bacterium]
MTKGTATIGVPINPAELEAIEIRLLLDAIYQRSGYDFRSYALASVERRCRQFLSLSGCATIAEMIPKVLHDEEFLSRLARYFSVSVTEMFRDPSVYRALREHVVPLLRTWPFFKVWHAGCATGEEVYSLAILLREEGICDRATIYATDFNDAVLQQAKEGIFPLASVQDATRNYLAAGGKGSLADYYHARYDAVAMDRTLRERVTFANHNLATDSAFGEMHLIFCRNVLIYFDQALQARVLRLFTESLVHGGFLCIGTKESLRFSAVSHAFEPVDEAARIYKKRAEA